MIFTCCVCTTNSVCVDRFDNPVMWAWSRAHKGVFCLFAAGVGVPSVFVI